MRDSHRWMTGLLCVGLLGLALGCGTPTTLVTAPTPETVQAGQGVVIVSLTSNTARAGQFGALTVHRAETPGQPAQDFRLEQASAGLSRDTSLFVGSLPPGHYAFTQLGAGTKYVSLGAKAQEMIGSFQVGPDETVDLGRLVLTGINDRILVGRSRTDLGNADLLKLTTPGLLALLQRKQAAGWTTPRNPTDRVEDFARSRVVGADGLKELPGGFVAAGSRLGVVIVRTPKGQWNGLRTGTLASILDLVPEAGEGRRLVAVGEFRTLLRIGRDWQPVFLDPGDLPPGNLFFVTGSEDQGWVVGHQAGTLLTFYRSPRLEAGHWTPLRQEQLKDSIWSGQNHVWAWPTAAGFDYATRFGGIHAFDLKAGRWSDVPLPKSCNLLEVSIQDRWSLLTSPGGGFGGVFATTYLSGDQGASWTEFQGPFKAQRQPPCCLPGGRMLVQGGLNASDLRLSEDGGKTWIPIQSFVSVADQLVATPTQGVYAIDDGSASFGFAGIRHSADGGRTWQLEYSTYVASPTAKAQPASRP